MLVTDEATFCHINSSFHPQSAVMLNIYSTGLNAQHFEDPLTFKPERWSRDESYELNPFSSLPFGFGPRSCYGEFRKDHC